MEPALYPSTLLALKGNQHRETYYKSKFSKKETVKAQTIQVNLYNTFLFFSFEDAVELLLKHGARVDVEARMCWPGTHQQNCEERVKHSRKGSSIYSSSSDKLQCAIYYAIDGDQVKMIQLLSIDNCMLLIQLFLQSPSLICLTILSAGRYFRASCAAGGRPLATVAAKTASAAHCL